MKVETLTFEYDHCGVCSNVSGPKYMKYVCKKTRRVIPDLYGEIPEWCPLPDKEVEDGS